jgi:hypothetical protein
MTRAISPKAMGKKAATIVLGVALPLVVSGAARPAEDCPVPPSQTLFACDIDALRPTQLSVGMAEVNARRAQLETKSPDKLDAYKTEHPEPVVRGPEGALYIIDRHHLARVLSEMGVKQTFCYVAADLSNLTKADFFVEMKKRNWVFLEDNTGARRETSDLPLRVGDLQDDPFRSLAGEVREEGGYEKSCEPFAEFKWADFFRAQIGPDRLARDPVQALNEANAMAVSLKACSLPGYKGAPCR